MYRAKISGLAALSVLYFSFCAGIAPGAAEQASSVPAIEEMPGMPEIPEMPNDQAGAPEKLTPYQAGVQSYLKGNDEASISQLQEALRLNADDEKAKLLLLKVMVRTINGNYERNNYKKAHSLIQAAHAYFPSNPEIRLLYSSMLESKAADKRKTPAARPENTPAPQTAAPPPRRKVKNRRPEPAPAPQQAVEDPAPYRQNPAVEPPRELPVPVKIKREAEPGNGRDNIIYLAAIAAALLLLTALLVFVYLQQKQGKSLLRRIESLQKALVDGEVKKAEIYKELETWKNLEKQDEELTALRRAKEQRMYLELEKLKAGEEAKILAELAVKRREAENAANLELESRRKPLPPRDPQAAGAASAAPAYPLPASAPQPVSVKSQEDKILEILVDITPPEREAAWERIAARSADLYETSPEAAIKFLYDLSRDANPLNRASIIGALAAIGAPATLDIIFELYNDASMEVRREAIKHLTKLRQNLTGTIDETYREKISACLREEKTKGDWVF
jgi:hypothetical protein